MIPFAHGRGFCVEAFNVSEVRLRVEHPLRLGWRGHKHWTGGLLERRLSQLAMCGVGRRSLIALGETNIVKIQHILQQKYGEIRHRLPFWRTKKNNH